MGFMEFDGKDLDEALAAAAAALGRPASEMDYELVEGGRKGVFGLGARPVRIRIANGDRAPQAPAPDGEPASAPARALADLIGRMRFDLRVEESRRNGSLELLLDGPDADRMTAKDGELLAAVEFVLNRMGRRQWPGEPSVRLQCRGFRNERDDGLVQQVREAAARVAESGQPRRLREMNPYERRVVHMTVREFDGLTTVSEGNGFLKRVRIEKIAP